MKYGQSNGWLDGQPAAITRTYGKGRITYVGTILNDNLMASATKWMVEKSGVTPTLGPVPAGVEVCRRAGAGKQVFILVNHTRERQHVTLPRSMRLLLEDKQGSDVDLPPYGVAVALDNP
jgi:beta-galactosidase